MVLLRRTSLFFISAFTLGLLYALWILPQRWSSISQAVGFNDMHSTPSSGLVPDNNGEMGVDHSATDDTVAEPVTLSGNLKPPGKAFSKTLVVARTTQEDTSWIDRELPDWNHAVYVVDDPTVPLHPPVNKGHEAMAYLTYIIDNYENLTEITAFTHSHQFAWHIDELLGGNAAEMLRRLNPARVAREGYMNLRCIWDPGCPDWMHPGTSEENSAKKEETMMAQSWREIFPGEPIPQVLAQPCCSQFAVSKAQILAIPKSRFVTYRDWLIRTKLSDYISGRIWEYLWHVVFAGQSVVCPMEHVCYCDGYGLCFGGSSEYDTVRQLIIQKSNFEFELKDWREKARTVEEARLSGALEKGKHVKFPTPGRDVALVAEIEEKERMLWDLVKQADARGADPKIRAQESGREWKDGDGF